VQGRWFKLKTARSLRTLKADIGGDSQRNQKRGGGETKRWLKHFLRFNVYEVPGDLIASGSSNWAGLLLRFRESSKSNK
jgi:hypothetical protein